MADTIPSPVAGSPCADGRDPPARWRWILLGAVLLVALTSLLCIGDTRRLHLATWLSDQAVYATVGRHLADTGEWGATFLYPQYFDRPEARFYMPGHFLGLAAAYRLFGYGTLPSLLPALLAYVAIVAATFHLAWRRYGTAAATLSSVLVAFFPPVLLLAPSAMSDLPVATALALAVVAYQGLGPRSRMALGPLLCGAAVLFRESNLLVLAPMVLVEVAGSARFPWRRVLWLAAAGGILALVLLRWQGATGKMTHPCLYSLAHGAYEFGSVPQPPLPDSPAGWLRVVPARFLWNVRQFLTLLRLEPLGVASAGTAIPVALGVLCLGVAARSRDRDPLLLSGAAILLAMSAAVFTLYNVYSGYRVLLPGLPFAVVALVGRALRRGEGGVGASARSRIALVLVLSTAYAACALAVTASKYRRLREDDEAMIARSDALDRSGHDPGTVLMAPPHLSLHYALERYPAVCTFAPANLETVDAFEGRMRVGTVVLRRELAGESALAEGLRARGFEPLPGSPLGEDLVVFRRKGP